MLLTPFKEIAEHLNVIVRLGGAQTPAGVSVISSLSIALALAAKKEKPKNQ